VCHPASQISMTSCHPDFLCVINVIEICSVSPMSSNLFFAGSDNIDNMERQQNEFLSLPQRIENLKNIQADLTHFGKSRQWINLRIMCNNLSSLFTYLPVPKLVDNLGIDFQDAMTSSQNFEEMSKFGLCLSSYLNQYVYTTKEEKKEQNTNYINTIEFKNILFSMSPSDDDDQQGINAVIMPTQAQIDKITNFFTILPTPPHKINRTPHNYVVKILKEVVGFESAEMKNNNTDGSMVKKCAVSECELGFFSLGISLVCVFSKNVFSNWFHCISVVSQF